MLLKIEIYKDCVYTGNFDFMRIQCESVWKMKTGWDLDKFFPANISTLSFGWYDVVAWGNVKSTLKQRCVFQRWNLQRRPTLNQCCVFQSWYKQR